jgi:hypothetical protein
MPDVVTRVPLSVATAPFTAHEAFLALARAQRRRPEIMGNSTRQNPMLFRAMGLFTMLAMHVGDLTHRICEYGTDREMGFGSVSEKVDRIIRNMDPVYEFRENVSVNIANNYENARREGSFSGTPEEYMEGFRIAALSYSEAHAALTVWNAAQFHAREAAVCLGRLDYDAALSHVATLSARLSSGRTSWSDWARVVTLGPDGSPMAYDPEMAEPEPGEEAPRRYI